ncbi:MAG TPA: hypothetical protein VGS41_08555, partial [Chthonomonadales bacterium]|nr:hypothetical protein [Chthonomonadales bacterium]
MLTVEEALCRALAQARPCSAETVSLTSALGRVLAEDVLLDSPLPPFHNSAVDGYAVRSEDVRGASPSHPVQLRQLADSPAGSAAGSAVTAGAAVRIMTGAPVPDGSDAIVMVEDTERLESGQVRILSEATAGQYIRHAGEDLAAGTLVLRSGELIRPAHLALLAAAGYGSPRVFRKPKVAILTTGDEVVDPVRGVPP